MLDKKPRTFVDQILVSKNLLKTAWTIMDHRQLKAPQGLGHELPKIPFELSIAREKNCEKIGRYYF